MDFESLKKDSETSQPIETVSLEEETPRFFQKEELRKMTNEELARVWKERWKGSQNKFAREYSLNQGNFSRWLQGKKDSMKSVKAVFRFLMGVGPEFDLPSEDIPPQEIVYRAGPRKDAREVFRESSITLKELMIRIENILSERLYGIVFLDADQYIHPIESFSSQPHLHSHFHFVICVSEKCLPRSLIRYLKEEWISVLVNESGVRDAADVDLTVAVTCLNQKLWGYPLPFTLVSRDHFVHLLKRRLDELSYRECLVYHPSKVVDFLQHTYQRLQ
jgi:hypothetical protein